MNKTKEDYERIYLEYHDKVFRYIFGKVNHYHNAEDLCSVVFLKVFQKIDDYDGSKASVSTWIYTITRNTVIDYYRTRKDLCELPETLAFCDMDPDCCTNENLEMLTFALERLEARQRHLIILCYYNGYTLKQIAEKMEMSYSNIKIIHSKALKELRRYMEA